MWIKRTGEGREGLAAVEFALVLPLFVVLLFVLVEGANALAMRQALVSASREAARLVLREGDSAQVQNLVDSLTTGMPGESPRATVSVDSAAQTVTVQVDYDYHSFYTDESFEQMFGTDPLVLSAATTMPFP
ncbi:MAG: pilus assembly protein [Desulfovibrionaceae bacterium]|jgi:Flp pilus assembly protein TadG|nr:pilus assembly protein [Desulfovibrionaceae bacterium]